jgi:hypothetical protein
MIRSSSSLALSIAFALMASACGDDSGEGGMAGTAGVAGSVSGNGGAAGMTSGEGGGGAGGAGAGGMAGGGAGGAGAGGAGAGGMAGAGGDGVEGCDVAMAGTPAELHDAALMALSATCGSSSSCHDGSSQGMKGMLSIPAGVDLNMQLVDKAACQAPTLSLIKSGGGDEALEGSWIWQKLTAPKDDSLNIIAKPEWGEPVLVGCGQASGFGTRMPQGGLDISPNRLVAVRNWICAGAAGP